MTGSLSWFWLALAFAILTSFTGPVVKKIILNTELFLSILFSGISVVLSLLLLMVFVGGFQIISPTFLKLVFIAAILDSIATISSYSAVKISPISLLAPISSFNPLFTTIIASISLNETLSPVKYLGIIVIVMGTYILNISEFKKGIFLPFKKLFTNKGVLFFLLANLLWAFTPIFQKQAIFQTKPSSPLFTSLIENIIIIAFFIPIVLIKTKKQFHKIKNTWKLFLIVGPIGALATWVGLTAFSIAPLGPVTAIFKISTLLTIGWGLIFFKEERILERLLGAIVMIIGTVLLLQ